MIERVLGAGVAVAEVFGDPEPPNAPPQEQAAVARAVPKRQREFLTVRGLAREAMGTIGVSGSAGFPILKGERGAPTWPSGVVGTLTHCDGYRGAAVAPALLVRSVGVDAEPHDTLPDGVLPAVSLPQERAWLGSAEARAADTHLDRVLFCAKEATYKAWFPVTRRWLGFEDAHITFTLDEGGRSGTFTSRILIDPKAVAGPPLAALEGRWLVDDGLVLAGVTLT